MRFTPIPAVDIRGGRCVRLLQGSFDAETVYGEDPVAMARHWEAAGAQRLHVVDLDGARDGVRVNAEVIARLVRAVQVPVQVGGGVRSLQVAKDVLATGADRVILGTVAVERLGELRQWVSELGPERVVVGVDTRDGFVATRGWENATRLHVDAFCQALEQVGVTRVFVTDISRDGTLEGPNVELIGRLVRGRRLRVLGSGGVSSVDDLRALAAAGAEGAIVGKALYEGRFTLEEALAPFGQDLPAAASSPAQPGQQVRAGC